MAVPKELADAAAAGLSDDQILKLLQQMTAQQQKEDDGLDIVPTPGFVIKTACTSYPPQSSKTAVGSRLPQGFAVNDKVFINVCSHEAVAGFKKEKHLRDSGDGEDEGIRIPVAVGPVVPTADKAGRPAVAVDIVVNPEVVADCDRDGTGSFRHWLVQLALQYVERKHGLGVSQQYRLPKLSYQGATVTKQRIRKPKHVGISEVPSAADKGKVSAPGSRSGGGAAAPFQVLAEAGGLPAVATALAPASKAGGAIPVTAAAPLRMPAAAPSVPMDIRVISEEGQSVADKIATEVSRSSGDEEEAAAAVAAKSGVKLADMLRVMPDGSKDSSGRVSSSGAPDVGLRAGVTRPVTKPVELGRPVVSVQVRPAGGAEGNSDTAAADAAVSYSSTGAGAALSVTATVALPPYAARNNMLDITITLPTVTGSASSAALTAASISARISGAGDLVTVSAPGYAALSIRLPQSATLMHGSSIVAPLARLDKQAKTVSITLQTAAPVSVPALPESLPADAAAAAALPDAGAAVRALLQQYVEADSARFTPDTGSRQWMLAHALASEDEELASASAGPAARGAAAAVADEEEELPEDRFLRSDALSMHYIKQREQDAQKKKEKEGKWQDEHGDARLVDEGPAFGDGDSDGAGGGGAGAGASSSSKKKEPAEDPHKVIPSTISLADPSLLTDLL